MKFKHSTNRGYFFKLKDFLKNLFFGLGRLATRLLKSIVLMSRLEKIISLILLTIVVVLSCVKINEYYIGSTKLVAGFGGSYKEVVLGDVRYLNPVLTSSDAEKSTSTLIFSSLFKFDKNENIIPDVASKWEASPDKLSYKVTLRDDVYFHDGEKLTAADIVYTIQTIQDPGFKSPLYETWKDIEVEETGENEVIFTLPRSYGSFIYALDFGILPIHLSLDDLSKTMIGSGPFKYDSSKKNGDKITQLNLQSNNDYYDGRPYLNKIELDFFDNKDSALTSFGVGSNYQAISGINTATKNFTNYSFSTAKQLVLVPNLRSDRFKNKDFRAQVISDQVMPEKTSVNLATADSELQRNKAEELKKSFANRNIELNIKYYKPTEMKSILDKKDYELLLFGFDFGHDRDPYIFWHSTQIDKMNYAGYSDKKSDIVLEDARMINDTTERNKKYDQFYETIKSESLAVYYEPIVYNLNISNTIKGIEVTGRTDADSKYLGINKWYINEKRVKK